MLTSILPTLYQGAVAPEAFEVEVNAGESGFDLTTATAAVLLVRQANGVETTWAPAVILSATAAQAILAYTFTGTELPVTGRYRFVPAFTVPGGTIRGQPFEANVKAKFDTSTS